MSSLTIERLIFDPADAADSANVGAYLRSAAGTLITHTTYGGIEALDVSISNTSPISVSISSVADDAADSGNPIKIGSRAIGTALAAVSATNDRADLISDLYRRVYINDSPNIGSAISVVSVGTTEIALPTTPLAGRRRMLLQNNSNNDVFVGPTGVTTADGIRVSKGSTLSLEIGENVALFGIAGSAANSMRTFELA